MRVQPDSGRRCRAAEFMGGDEVMGNSFTSLAGDQTLAIAQADAARVYRDLSLYRIQLVLEDDGWTSITN